MPESAMRTFVARLTAFPLRLKPHFAGWTDGGAEAPPLQSKRLLKLRGSEALHSGN